MALADFFEAFVKLTRSDEKSGFGTSIDGWTDGVTFQAGISTKVSTEALIAQQTGSKAIYVIVTQDDIPLSVDDRVKRVSDGQRFRITSNASDMQTPNVAQVAFKQVTAEVVSTS